MSSAPEMPLPNLVAARLFLPGTNFTVQNAMATLITPTIAITPDHVLQPYDSGTPQTDIKVKLHFDARPDISIEVEATVIARDPAVDFAVLQLKAGFSLNLPAGILADEPPQRGAYWQSLLLTPDNDTAYGVNGAVVGLETYEGREHLRLTAERASVRGSSGAPIIADNHIVGIMARRDERENIWHAIPVTAMLKSRVTPDLKSLLANEPPVKAEATIVDSNETVNAEGSVTPDNTTLYQRLSPSSRRAFNHAEGLRLALERDVVHMEHLLAGLFEKTDGPTQRVLKEVGIDAERLHQMLEEEAERDFPHSDQYTPAALDALPRLSAHVYEALRAANAVADASGTKQIQSRHLIYGALSVEHCGMIKRLLALKVDKNRIDLTTEMPPDITAPQIAGYQSDGPADKDLLGISREVQALCAVLSAKDVQPPLSLGLFGEWGSGKSSFMRQMELQINANRADAQANPDSPYCRDIVQLWFNAWHYMDVDLWATLAHKILGDLKESLVVPATPKKPEEREYERAKLLAQSLKAKEELASAQETQQKLEAQVQKTETQLAALTRGEGTLKISPFELLDDIAGLADTQDDDKKKDEKDGPKKADKLENNVTAKLDTDVVTVQSQLMEVKGLWQQARALWLAVRYLKSRWLWLSLILLILVGGMLWVWWQNRLPNVPEALTALIALLVSSAPFLSMAKRLLGFVNGAIKTREKTLQDQRTALQGKLQAQQKTVHEKAQAAQAAEEKLEELRADKQITSFIKQRTASNDYAQYRGTIAKVRDDFDQLSKLLATEREQRETANLSDEEALLPRIDRIILYIDDLDRCPENKVVDVLQAVHLLLAFPLFVVVVGVDPRWLLHSLKRHSDAFRTPAKAEEGLSEEESSHWQSTPLNYLEKIFQIPFTLRPMAQPGFQELIENLALARPAKRSRPSAVAPTATTSAETATDVAAPVSEPVNHTNPSTATVATVETKTDNATPSNSEVLPVDPVIPPAPVVINPEFLQIEEWERQAMKQLYCLIPSPRAAKRFVNLYRLLRVSVAPEKRAAFISQERPAQHRAALLLLAMLIGYPTETTDFLCALRKQAADKPWWEFWKSVTTAPPDGDDAESAILPFAENKWAELIEKLSREEIRTLIPAEQTCEHFIGYANEVARYSFQSGRILLA